MEDKQVAVMDHRENLRRVIAATHEHHKGKPGHYRINVVMAGGLETIGKDQLEKMGCTVREPMKLEDKGKA